MHSLPNLRLPPRYQPIWTIYIPFESPWLIDFRNARFDLNFWRYVMPCGATLCKLVFSGGIAAWERRHTRKTIRLKIFPNLLFYQFISKLFASRSTLCHLSMTQRSWENLDYIKFRSTFAVSIEASKFSEAKNFQIYKKLFFSGQVPPEFLKLGTRKQNQMVKALYKQM